jgi:RNA polymerase sigma-70 factor (ECF subfamily)
MIALPTSILQSHAAVSGVLELALPDDADVIALVDRVVSSRDAAAFGELYDRFLTRIYRYVYYRTGNQADAEDLSEQVFLQAWAAIDRFRWRGKPFQAWLYSLAHNVLVDHCRRARLTESFEDKLETAQLASEPAKRELEQWMNADMLAGAIGQLPREQQHVIAMRFLEGRDTAEVARLMEKQESTIRQLQYRALQNLRRDLERHEEWDTG